MDFGESVVNPHIVLTDADMSELPEIGLWIPKHRFGFRCKEDCILGCDMARLPHGHPFLYHPEIRISNILVNEELTVSIRRHQAVALRLPVVYRTQFRAVWCELNPYHPTFEDYNQETVSDLSRQIPHQ